MAEMITVERRGSAALITLNRPRSLNALNVQLIHELDTALDELAVPDVRAIIITGSGERAFAAGADIAEFQGMGDALGGYRHARFFHAMMRKMHRMDQPIICAVNGFALGGGCELAMAGDIIIAAEHARFGQPEVNLGLIPGFGGSQNLPRLVGRANAMDMILTGEPVTAQRALEMGLVSRVVPREQLLDTAFGIAETIAGKSPLAIALAKRAVYEGLEAPPTAGGDIEVGLFTLAFGSEDRKEGTSAFLEKRPAAWQGK